MTTPAVTPNPTDNPFDSPLPSEVQDHQQASAATVASGGSPFDDPLPSEKAEQTARANPEQAASNTRQMLVSGLTGMPTPNMTEQDRASFERGKAAGAVSVPLVAGAMTTDPLITAIGTHLGVLNKIVNLAKQYGWGVDIGYREARDLYKEFSKGDK